MQLRTTLRMRAASLLLAALGLCAACSYDWTTPDLPDGGADASSGTGGNGWGGSGQGGSGEGGWSWGGAAGQGGSNFNCASLGSSIESAIATGKVCTDASDCTKSIVDPCGCLQFVNDATVLPFLEDDLDSFKNAGCTEGYSCPAACADAGVADCVDLKCAP